MPKSTVAGHPAHPQLVTIPIGLFPFSLAMDLLHGVTGQKRFSEAADLAMIGAVAGAVTAAAAGAMDYLEIPEDHPSKPVARLHGGLNLGLVGLFGANLLLRRREPRGSWPTLLSALGNAALVVSAWYGGHLVYEHGVRVRSMSPIEHAPELAPPGDEALVRALEAPISGRR
jgi:uncharacterized membrane protein